MDEMTFRDLADQKFIRWDVWYSLDPNLHNGYNKKATLICAEGDFPANLTELLSKILYARVYIDPELRSFRTNEIVPPPARYAIETERGAFLILEKPDPQTDPIVVERRKFQPTIFRLPDSPDMTPREKEVLRQLTNFNTIDLSRFGFDSRRLTREAPSIPPCKRKI